MNPLRKLRKKEYAALPSLCERQVRRVNEILQEDYDKEIFRVTRHNQQRLLTLRLWEKKYSVSLQYILSVIVPYYMARFKKHRRGNPNALGINIPTLVGKNAERLLREQIQIDFPQGEHLSIRRWEQIQDIIRRRTSDEFEDTSQSSAPLAKVGSIKKYVQRYRNRIENSRVEFEKEISRKSNTRRPYRGNPFV